MQYGAVPLDRNNPHYAPDVVQAIALDDGYVKAYFDDGSIRTYDMKPIIAGGGVFDHLKDATFFKERITVLNNTVAWDVTGTFDPFDCIDIDPCDIYHHGQKVLE